MSLATGRAWCCSVPRGPRAALRPAGQSHTYAMARWRTTTTSGQDGVRGELKADPSACHDGFPELASAFAAPRPAVGARRVLLLALWMGLVHANIVAVLLAIGSVAWYSRAGAAAPAVDVLFGGYPIAGSHSVFAHALLAAFVVSIVIFLMACAASACLPLTYSPAWGKRLATDIAATAEDYFEVSVVGDGFNVLLREGGAMLDEEGADSSKSGGIDGQTEGVERSTAHTGRQAAPLRRRNVGLDSGGGVAGGPRAGPAAQATSSTPYVFAVSPHNVLPISFIAFSPGGPLMRLLGRRLPSVAGSRGVASSAIFYVPLMRHLWGWLGLTSATRANISALLGSGSSVVICPGGVREAMYMDHRVETLFLRERRGFVRLALLHCAPIVPVFAFGQRDAFRWWRPPMGEAMGSLSRTIGYVPMLFWGRLGSPLPYKTRLTLAVGSPLARPAGLAPGDAPSAEQVEATLGAYVDAIKALFDERKAEAGYPDLELRVL